MNKVVLIGNVCNEVELRYTTKEVPVANFTVATNEYNDGDQITEFHHIALFGRGAIKSHEIIRKGNLVSIEGAIKYFKFPDGNNGTNIVAEGFRILK